MMLSCRRSLLALLCFGFLWFPAGYAKPRTRTGIFGTVGGSSIEQGNFGQQQHDVLSAAEITSVVESASRLLEQQDYSGADRKLTGLLVDPAYSKVCLAQALYLRAEARARQRQFESALNDLNVAATCYPSSTLLFEGRDDDPIYEIHRMNFGFGQCGELFARRAEIHRVMGHQEQAIADYGHAIEMLDIREPACTGNLTSVHILYRQQRAQIFEQIGHRRQAVKDLRVIAHRLDRSNPLAWFELAQRDIADRRKAVEAYERAIELDPFTPRYHHFLGHIQWVRGEVEEAERAFHQAVQLNPHEPCYIPWGNMLKEAGRHEEAVSKLRWCSFPRPEISREQGADCHHALGDCYHALGRFRLALQHYDAAMELDPNRRQLLTWYQREYMLFHHHHLDDIVSHYNLDQEMGPQWLDGWAMASLPMVHPTVQLHYQPKPSLNPRIPDVDDDLFPLDATGQIAGNGGVLLCGGNRFIFLYKLKSPGFVSNPRVLRAHSLAVLDVAQQIRQVFDAGQPVMVRDQGASGGCTGGFGLEGEGKGVGFGAGQCPLGGSHPYGWRDAFDVVVRWRSMSGVTETVEWCDTSLAFRSDDNLAVTGYGETKLVDGDVTSHKYYTYYPICFERLKAEALKFQPDRSPHSEMIAEQIRNARSPEDVGRALGRESYAVEMKIQHPLQPDIWLPGTRLHIERSREESGFSLAIRTMRDRPRVAAYNAAMRSLWSQYVDAGQQIVAGEHAVVVDQRSSRRVCVEIAMKIAHLWVNMMPLNRGTAGTAITMLQGMMLSCGVEAVARTPPQMQIDWEALLTEKPEDYVLLLSKYLTPEGISPKGSDLLHRMPLVTDVLPTARHIFALLNVAVRVLPIP